MLLELLLTWPLYRHACALPSQVMTYHAPSRIYASMSSLLHYMACYLPCVDLRDRAVLYLKLLTHAGSAVLGGGRGLGTVWPKYMRVMNCALAWSTMRCVLADDAYCTVLSPSVL